MPLSSDYLAFAGAGAERLVFTKSEVVYYQVLHTDEEREERSLQERLDAIEARHQDLAKTVTTSRSNRAASPTPAGRTRARAGIATPGEVARERLRHGSRDLPTRRGSYYPMWDQMGASAKGIPSES
jgi:hypothetical protein